MSACSPNEHTWLDKGLFNATSMSHARLQALACHGILAACTLDPSQLFLGVKADIRILNVESYAAMQLEVCSTVQFGSAKAFTAQCREDGAQAFHKNSGTSTQILSQLASSDFLPHESVPEIYLGSAQGLFEGKKRHTDSPHVWWIKTYEKRVL